VVGASLASTCALFTIAFEIVGVACRAGRCTVTESSSLCYTLWCFVVALVTVAMAFGALASSATGPTCLAVSLTGTGSSGSHFVRECCGTFFFSARFVSNIIYIYMMIDSDGDVQHGHPRRDLPLYTLPRVKCLFKRKSFAKISAYRTPRLRLILQTT